MFSPCLKLSTSARGRGRVGSFPNFWLLKGRMLATHLGSTPDAHFYAASELINIMSVVIVACSALLRCLPPCTH